MKLNYSTIVNGSPVQCTQVYRFDNNHLFLMLLDAFITLSPSTQRAGSRISTLLETYSVV